MINIVDSNLVMYGKTYSVFLLLVGNFIDSLITSFSTENSVTHKYTSSVKGLGIMSNGDHFFSRGFKINTATYMVV